MPPPVTCVMPTGGTNGAMNPPTGGAGDWRGTASPLAVGVSAGTIDVTAAAVVDAGPDAADSSAVVVVVVLVLCVAAGDSATDSGVGAFVPMAG